MRERSPLGRWLGRRQRPDSSALTDDTRAVSVTVGYVLTLAIGAVVLSGVVIGVSGVIDSQTDRTIRGDLSVVGQTTVANLENADRLARAGTADRPGTTGDVHVGVDVDLPTRIAGVPYQLTVDNETVTLQTDNPDAVVSIPHTTDRPVATTTLSGGPVRITYHVQAGESGPGTLEVRAR